MPAEQFITGKPETRRKLNLLVAAVKSLENINGDVFIRTANTPSGTTIRLNIAAVLERIMKNSGESSSKEMYGVGVAGSAGWFNLTNVGSNPMAGTLQTNSSGSFSNVSGASSTDIYIHPESSLSNYDTNNIIFASFVGDSWVSVNIFSSGDQVEDLMANLLDVCV